MKGGEGVGVEQTPSWAPSLFLHSGKQSEPHALAGSVKPQSPGIKGGTHTCPRPLHPRRQARQFQCVTSLNCV